MNRVLLLVGVFVFLFSVSRADVEVTGICQTDCTYCPGETVSFTCKSDSGNTSITIDETSVQYTDSDSIGTQWSRIINGVTVSYNKTDDDSIWVWFKASRGMNGYSLECRDIDDDGAENCTLQVNIAEVPSAQTFGVDNARYCNSTNFTWSFMNGPGYSCLQEFVINVKRDSVSVLNYTVAPNDTLSYTLTEATASNSEACLSIASRSRYEGDLFMSEERCVRFDVPKQPMELMETYNIDSQNNEGEINVTMRWTRPDRSRPNVMWYYIWTNITDNDNDNDNDDSSGSGQQPTAGDMDMYRNIRIPGDRWMMRLPGAKEGYYYTVRLTAENCYGNSSTRNISFKVEREATTAPTTTTATSATTETPEPSSSPTLDNESDEFPTWAIAVIAVVASLLIVCLVTSVLLIICCCCFGTAAICVCCAADKGHEIEMEKRGTDL